MKKLTISILLLSISTSVSCMNGAKRKFDPEDIANQMAIISRADDIALINSIATGIKNKKKPNIEKLIRKKRRTPILHGILASGEYESEWFSTLKNKLLIEIFEDQDDIDYQKYTSDKLQKMDLLLKYGANPQGKLEGYLKQCTCIAYASMNAAALTVFLKNGIDPNSLFDKKNTLMMHATEKYSEERYRDGPAKACMNVLLFFGADMQIKIADRSVFDVAVWNQDAREFIKHAHARRVNRLAQYLMRCTHMCKDVTLEIAQHHYGRLSDEDNKLISTYPAFGYKKGSL